MKKHESGENLENREAELLKKIHLKEDEIENSILEARAHAHEEVAAAQKVREDVLRKAEEDARAEAKRYRKGREIEMERRASAILAQAAVEAQEIKQEAEKNSDSALRLVLEHVLPSLKDARKERFNAVGSPR